VTPPAENDRIKANQNVAESIRAAAANFYRDRARLIICGFGVAANPVFKAFFFFLFVGVMHFCVEPTQLNHFL
jgi:hypothetical protein